MKDDIIDDNLEHGMEIKPRVTKRIAWSGAFVALCGSWQYGFSIGSINAVHFPIKEAIRTDLGARYDTNVTEEVVEGIWVASSAAFPAGGTLGAVLLSTFARKFKTLDGLTIGHVLTMIFSVLMGVSGVAHSPEFLIFGRLGVGLTSALVTTGLSLVYVVEVSPQHLRGRFGTMIGIGIAGGLAISNALGLPQCLGNKQFWPLLLALTGAPSVIFLVLKRTFVDTSRQQYHVDSEIQLQSFADRSENKPFAKTMSVREVLLSSTVRRQLICAVTLCASYQMTGLNGVAFNMNVIYSKAGIPANYVYYVSIGVSSTVVLLNLVSAKVTDKYGRKPMLLVGYAIEAASLLVLAAAIETQQFSGTMAYIAVVASVGFWVGFSAGPGPLTLVTASEFFDVTARSAGMTIATVFMWLSFTIIVVCTRYMMASSIRGFTFLPFGILALLTLVFIWRFVPETKNRSFSEIQNKFTRANDKE